MNIDDLIETFAARVAAHLAQRLSAERQETEEVDQTTAPIGRNQYLKAARERAFPTRKAGRRVIARQADVLAWLRKQTITEVKTEAPISRQSVRDKITGRKTNGT